MFGSNNPLGQPSSSPFGSQSVFGQTSSTSTNPFAPKPFGSTNAFGSQPGGGLVFGGTSTNMFGQASSPLASQPAFGASSAPAFGSSMPSFGTSSTPAFGSSTSSFGGAPTATTFGNPSIGQTILGGQQVGSKVAPFTTTPEIDGSTGSQTAGNLESISAMHVYKDKSFEELRWEDYQFGDKGSCVSGQNPAFGAFGSSQNQAPQKWEDYQHTQSAFGSNLFGSSSTPAFGSASTPAFGSASAPAFGATTTPAFGATTSPAFDATTTPSFGSTSTPAFRSTTPLFGGTGAGFGVSSTLSFGSSVTPAFGYSSPLFGSSVTPAFGTSSTPVFGSSSTPAFGSSTTPSFGFGSAPFFSQSTSTYGSTPFGTTPSPFGAQSSPFGSCGGFGSSPTQASPFGSTFQHTPSALGSNLFGSSSTPAFGSGSTPAFRATTRPSFGSTSTPGFGSTRAGFGFSSTPSFGSYVIPAFGSSSPLFESSTTPAFGTSTPAFGSSTTPTATATFGSPGIGQMAFGGQQIGSRVAPYTTTPETDLCTGSRTAGKLESISAMSGYKDKSVEELRWEDYQRGDKGRSGDASGWSRVLLYLLKLSVLALPMLYGIGQMVSGGGQQVGGSRVAPYTTTPETDLSTGSQTAGKLESISAMSMYKEKSFEELRWEDYQRGDKGRNRDASGWSRVLFFLRR